MSAKATGLVWDLECPKDYDGIAFRPSHKYTLVAYADHADHNGKNIWPAVKTIAKKTGLDERTVQRITNDLESIGLLVEDGKGPRGTNKWYLPYSPGGDTLTPRHHDGGDKIEESLGDIPSGDIPSGDTTPPEFKEPEPYIDIRIGNQKVSDVWKTAIEVLNQDRQVFPGAITRLENSRPASYSDGILTVKAKNQDDSDWLDQRMKRTVERMMVGIVGQTVTIQFLAE